MIVTWIIIAVLALMFGTAIYFLTKLHLDNRSLERLVLQQDDALAGMRSESLLDRDKIASLERQVRQLKDNTITIPVETLEVNYAVSQRDKDRENDPYFMQRVEEHLSKMMEQALISQKVGWASNMTISREEVPMQPDPTTMFRAHLLVMMPRMLAPGQKVQMIGHPFELDDGRFVRFVRKEL